MVDRTLVIPLLRGLTRTLESRGEKGVGSVRLRIVEGYVFYPSTAAKKIYISELKYLNRLSQEVHTPA
jgi:hypothetical protein